MRRPSSCGVPRDLGPSSETRPGPGGRGGSTSSPRARRLSEVGALEQRKRSHPPPPPADRRFAAFMCLCHHGGDSRETTPVSPGEPSVHTASSLPRKKKKKEKKRNLRGVCGPERPSPRPGVSCQPRGAGGEASGARWCGGRGRGGPPAPRLAWPWWRSGIFRRRLTYASMAFSCALGGGARRAPRRGTFSAARGSTWRKGALQAGGGPLRPPGPPGLPGLGGLSLPRRLRPSRPLSTPPPCRPVRVVSCRVVSCRVVSFRFVSFRFVSCRFLVRVAEAAGTSGHEAPAPGPPPPLEADNFGQALCAPRHCTHASSRVPGLSLQGGGRPRRRLW